MPTCKDRIGHAWPHLFRMFLGSGPLPKHHIFASHSFAVHPHLLTSFPLFPFADLDLAAFPPLSRQEAPESRRARAQAYVSASAMLKDRYTVGGSLAHACEGRRAKLMVRACGG